jgi:ABC-2 type transport system permease protein
MNSLIIIARKEIRELLDNKGILLTSLGFAIFFSIYQSMALTSFKQSPGVMSADGSIFFLTSAIGFFITYLSVSQVFLREKMDRVIETLLCAPLSLRQIWGGKLIAVTVFSYLISLVTALIIVGVLSYNSRSVIVPGVQVIVHCLVVLPVFIAALGGLMGYIQFLLGMKENRILNLVVMVPAMAAVYGIGLSAGSGMSVSWIYIGLFFAVSLALLIIITAMTKRLSTERIVTTLPEIG